jgi:hypothetical protein
MELVMVGEDSSVLIRLQGPDPGIVRIINTVSPNLPRLVHGAYEGGGNIKRGIKEPVH